LPSAVGQVAAVRPINFNFPKHFLIRATHAFQTYNRMGDLSDARAVTTTLTTGPTN